MNRTTKPFYKPSNKFTCFQWKWGACGRAYQPGPENPNWCCCWCFDGGTWMDSCPSILERRWMTRSSYGIDWNVQSAAQRKTWEVNVPSHSETNTHFQVKTSNDWQFLHRQLFGGFLVAKTSRTLDLSRRSQVLCPGESLQTVLQGSGNRSRAVASGYNFRAGGRTEVQGNIPKGIYCCRDTAAVTKTK